jgi:hypothetical protein
MRHTQCRKAAWIVRGLTCVLGGLVLGAAVCVVAPAPVAAQSGEAEARTDTIFDARRPSGWNATGRIVEQHGDSVVFLTMEGHRISFDRRTVSLRPARGRMVDGEFWREDGNLSRLFFAPTGRTLHANQGYAGVFLILPFVGFGFNDNFTLAGGIPQLIPAGELANTPFYIAPKLRVNATPDRQVAVGGFLLHVPNESEIWGDGSMRDDDAARWVGIGYGVSTFGTTDRAVHLGTGFVVTDGTEGPFFPMMLGGEYRFGRTSKWISENWWIPGEFAAAAGGIRMMRTNWTTDLGLIFVLSEENIPYFPILSVSYSFGSGR